MVRALTREEFDARCFAMFGDTFKVSDFTKIQTVPGKNVKLLMLCCEHGEVEVSQSRTLAGAGCPKCGIEKKNKEAFRTLEEYVIKAREKHGDLYKYLDIDKLNITYTCPTHGKITTNKANHLKGYICPKCGRAGAMDGIRDTLESYARKASEVHSNIYKYLSVDSESVLYECNRHGVVVQSRRNHIQGTGCPHCGTIGCSSSFSEKVSNWLNLLRIEHSLENNAPYRGTRFRADIVVKNLVVELNGEYWHTEDRVGVSRHKDKRELALANGYKIAMFTDTEWRTKEEVIKSWLLQEITNASTVEFDRRLPYSTVELSAAEAALHLEKTKLLTSRPADVWVGLKQDNVLLNVAGFKLVTSKRKRLNCMSEACVIAVSDVAPEGSLAPILHYAQQLLGFAILKAISDDRFFKSSAFLQCGFTPHSKLNPAYTYSKSGNPVARKEVQKSALAVNPKALYDESLTVCELLGLNGIKRLYDAGRTLWIKNYK